MMHLPQAADQNSRHFWFILAGHIKGWFVGQKEKKMKGSIKKESTCYFFSIDFLYFLCPPNQL